MTKAQFNSTYVKFIDKQGHFSEFMDSEIAFVNWVICARAVLCSSIIYKIRK